MSEVIDWELRVHVSEETKNALKEGLDLFTQWTTFLNRLNLPEDVDAQITKIVQVITLLNTLRFTWALTAATTPLAPLLAIPAIAGLSYSVASTADSLTRRPRY